MVDVALGDVVQFTNGGTPSRQRQEFYEGDIPWVTGADIDGNQRVTARSFITSNAVANSATSVLPAGTVALVTRTSVGKVGVFDRPTAFSQDITAITPSERVDGSYLTHFLRSSAGELARHARGATIKGVTRAVVESLRLPLPSIERQRRIVAILDTADAICSKRRALLAHLDALAEACFHQNFAAVRATVTVESVAQRMRTGPFGSDLLHSEFVDSGISVLGLDNVVANEFRWGERRYITPEKYQSLQRYRVEPGDVLVSIMGTTGRCVVVPDNIPVAINTKHICATTVDSHKVEPEFLRASFLWHPDSRAYLRRQTKGAVMDGLNMGIIKTMPIPLPPLADQRAFADKVAKIDAQRAIVKRVLAADDELFASLQSRAFSGKL